MEDYTVQYTKKQYTRLIVLVSILTSLAVTLAFNLLLYGLPARGFSLPAQPTFAIRSIYPTSIPVNPDSVEGVDLSVNGVGFLGGSVVYFGSTALQTTYVSQNQLAAIIPLENLGSAGIVNITVQNPAPNSATSNSMPFMVLPNLLPTITSLSRYWTFRNNPSNIVLNIFGVNFAKNCVVTLNNVPVTPTFFSPNSLSITIPASSFTVSATLNINVVNPSPVWNPPVGTSSTRPIWNPPATYSGASNTAYFVVRPNNNPVLGIDGVNPSLVPVGTTETTVTVTGTNFSSNLRAYFDGASYPVTLTPITPTNNSTTQLTFSIPQSELASSKAGTIILRPPTGTPSNSVPFVVGNPVPSISGVRPGTEELPITTANTNVRLTVSGTGFIRNVSKIYISGYERTTRYDIDPSGRVISLYTILPASEVSVAEPGYRLVTVFNPRYVGGFSESRHIKIVSSQ